MKKIVLSVLALACSGSSLFSQVVLQENFTSPFNVSTAGWSQTNLSSSTGSVPLWGQGASGVFSSYNGGPNDYFRCNFASAVGSSTISNWLITPTLTLVDGAVFQFATRVRGGGASATSPDRLQIRMSTSGTSTNIPSGAASVAPFTSLMLDINPLYSLSNAAAVSNGSVNGYPAVWTVYTVQVTGVPVPTTGRFAFRYFVENGGPTGVNADYIGIDAVQYSMPPCLPTVQSYTTCAGVTTTLTALGLSSTTYSWSTGSTGSVIVVNPAATTVYSVFPIDNGVPCPNPVTVSVTTSGTMNVSIASSANTNTLCSGRTITLTANAPANSYAWNTSVTLQTIAVTPTVGTTTYIVGALNGACTGSASIGITVLASPNLSVNLSPACVGGSLTVTATGADTYTFLGQNASPFTIGLAAAGATAAGAYNFVIGASNANGCAVAGSVQFSVSAPPVLIVTPASGTVICVNRTLTISAGGANTYSWTGAPTNTNTSFTYSSGTAGLKSFTVVGTATTGCSSTVVRTVSVSACTGIEDQFGNAIETSVFPNPFANELRVTALNGHVEIYNALGQMVLNVVVNETETINTSEFVKGVYILKVFNNEGTEIKATRLIKN